MRLLAIALVLAGCTATPPVAPATTPGTTLVTVDRSFPADATIEVQVVAGQRIMQNGQPLTELRVEAGKEYLFRVTNTSAGTEQHNFYIGKAEDLAARKIDHLTGVPIFIDGSQEFVYTFESDQAPLQFACVLAGHYGPMHGDFIIE
ncbi:MAG TPA: hypothetical protein VGQ47_03305 [Candidatus Limnocylindrales bacterium]|jgi:hypothetical protein|nr:hypothetical protein [Candidatus Limnocylindrales bacterium]